MKEFRSKSLKSVKFIDTRSVKDKPKVTKLFSQDDVVGQTPLADVVLDLQPNIKETAKTPDTDKIIQNRSGLEVIQDALKVLKYEHEMAMLKVQFQKEKMLSMREMKQLEAEMEREIENDKLATDSIQVPSEKTIDWNNLRRTPYDISRGFCIQWHCIDGLFDPSSNYVYLNFAVFHGPDSIKNTHFLGPYPIEISGTSHCLINEISNITGINPTATSRIIVDIRTTPDINNSSIDFRVGWGSFDLFESKVAMCVGEWY
jgi:hypothetical protein